jgi:hypothetical protein
MINSMVGRGELKALSMPELLSKNRTILERLMMEFRPFGWSFSTWRRL